MFDPTLHPHLAKALTVHDAQYDYDEHGAPATEQFHDYCDRVRAEERTRLAQELTKLSIEIKKATKELVAAWKYDGPNLATEMARECLLRCADQVAEIGKDQ
jgi:hypothetical protein